MHTNKENNSLNGIATFGLSGPTIKAVTDDELLKVIPLSILQGDAGVGKQCFFYSHPRAHRIYQNKRNQDHAWANTHVPAVTIQNYIIYIKSTFATHAKQRVS